jgi:hypothetical protein
MGDFVMRSERMQMNLSGTYNLEKLAKMGFEVTT